MKTGITGKVSIWIDATAEEVWKALTTPELIKQYFFNTNAVSNWKVGSPILFHGEWEGKQYEDKGTIKEIIPEKFLRYSYWSSLSGIEEKPENYVDITYALTEENGGTTLVITQENIPDEKMREHSEENWNKVVEGLKDLVEKQNVMA
ncbi:MAG: SRPBCC family protein [Bacteroidota bacterium]